jgi:hypothetical protein
VPFAVSFRTPLAALVFTGTAIPNIADNAASSPITSIYIGLHTADPSSGNQTTSEASYTSYARQAVARVADGFDEGLDDGDITNDDEIAFPTATGGSSTVTHASCGTAASGTGVLIIAGALTASRVISTGILPRFAVGSFDIEIA